MADPEAQETEQLVRDTEDELLKSAFTDKEPDKPPEEGEAPKAERARDPETGRFAKRPDAGEAPPQTEGEKLSPEPEKPEEHVPSWRLREINEERRRIEVERDQMRAEMARQQARLAEFERAQQRAQAPPPPDPLIDPQGFAKQVRDEMRAEFMAQQQSDRLSMNLEMAHMRHGEKFEKAYEALIVEGQRGNAALVRHFVAQPNPGEAIVRWYTQNEVLREVGGDAQAYKQKTREQLLKDPEFLAQAIEASRQLAAGANGQPPNAVVKLPPSLSKATGNADMPAGPQPKSDGSDAGVFSYVMSQPRRR
jgi:hypothetical protein